MPHWLRALLHEQAGAAGPEMFEGVDPRIVDADGEQLRQTRDSLHAELETLGEPNAAAADLGLELTERRRSARNSMRARTRKRR